MLQQMTPIAYLNDAGSLGGHNQLEKIFSNQSFI